MTFNKSNYNFHAFLEKGADKLDDTEKAYVKMKGRELAEKIWQQHKDRPLIVAALGNQLIKLAADKLPKPEPTPDVGPAWNFDEVE